MRRVRSGVAMTEPCSICGTPLHLHTSTPTRPLLCSECRDPRLPCPSCRGTGEGSVVYLSVRPATPGERRLSRTHRERCAACQGSGRAS